MSDKLLVRVLRDFYKTGKGENARGFRGDVIEISPELAEYLADRNIIEVILEDDEELTTWQQ